jgi:threonine 3-dehydrogenase
MKGLFKDGPGIGLTLKETVEPRPGENDLLVEVKGVAICGSDVQIYNWSDWCERILQLPVLTGHEFAGEVLEVGEKVKGFEPGDFVSVESRVYCGTCYQCRTGKRHLCNNLRIIGAHQNGGFARFAVIPEICAWKMPPDTPLEVACIMDPIGLAVHAALEEDVSGLSVAVFGCGPVGILAGSAAKAGGAQRVIAASRTPYRMALAKRMGVDETIDITTQDPFEAIMDFTDGEGVDFVLDMSGAQTAINTGLKVLKRGGRFTAFGIPTKPVTVDWTNQIVFKGIKISAIMGRRIWETWYKAVGLLNTGKLDPTPVVTHRFPLEEYQTAFDILQSKEKEVGRILLLPQAA